MKPWKDKRLYADHAELNHHISLIFTMPVVVVTLISVETRATAIFQNQQVYSYWKNRAASMLRTAGHKVSGSFVI
jgi:hypothetical protein